MEYKFPPTYQDVDVSEMLPTQVLPLHRDPPPQSKKTMDDKDSKTHEPGSNRESQISVVVSDVGTPPGKAAEDTATEEAPMTEEAHRSMDSVPKRLGYMAC